jgi:hypothetical protein
MHEYGEVISAGIDWVTATGATGDTQGFVRSIGFDQLDAARRDGNAVHPWAWKGYRGWAGGGASMGTRDDGSIVRLTGDRAAGAGRTLCESGASISRLDVQATVRFDRDLPGLADEHAAEVQAHQRAGGINRNLRHQRGFGAGDSFYVGSRQSNYYGRVYDKGRESRDERYRQCWRYEVECKDDGAKQARQAVRAAEDISASSAAMVADWFGRRGCAVRYRSELAVQLAPVGRHHSDLDTWLAWLLQAVRPTVQKCLLYVPRETIEEVLFGPDVLEQAGYGRSERDDPGVPIVDMAPLK